MEKPNNDKNLILTIILVMLILVLCCCSYIFGFIGGLNKETQFRDAFQVQLGINAKWIQEYSKLQGHYVDCVLDEARLLINQSIYNESEGVW